MAPLPPNNTARYFFKYAVSGVPHKLIIRTDGEQTDDDISSLLSAILTEVGEGFFASASVGLDYQPAGSAFSVPAVYTGSVTTWGSGAAGDGGTPMFAGQAGRGLDGRRSTWHLFGFKGLSSVGDYRFPLSGSAPWAAAAAAIAAASGAFLTIGGVKATYHEYVNVGVNAYWQRQMRLT